VPLVEAQAEAEGAAVAEAQGVAVKLCRAAEGEAETVPLVVAVLHSLPEGVPEGVKLKVAVVLPLLQALAVRKGEGEPDRLSVPLPVAQALLLRAPLAVTLALPVTVSVPLGV
jgi:hypothetical protein